MPVKLQVRIVVISVVIAALIALALVKSLQPPPSKVHILNDTDDAPIIMAGGSLYIGTGPDGVFSRDSTKTTLVYTAGLKVFEIDLAVLQGESHTLSPSDVMKWGGRIDLKYCRIQLQTGACGDTDMVTLNFNNATGGGPITITNQLNNIGAAPRILPTLLVHLRRAWKLFHVKATDGSNTQEGDCGPDAECNIVVHTCLKGTGCTASQ